MSKITVLFGVFTLFGIFTVFSNLAFASCAVNEDWPDAPCFDVLPVNREEYRAAWAPYYDYKGSEWMEQKKADMFDAKNSERLAEWMDDGIQNHNVFSYYQSKGEISFPPEYDRPFFEDDFRYNLQFNQVWPFTIIGIVSGLAAIGVFILIKKMKASKLLYRINLGLVLFLGTGWFYFYWFILTKNIEGMPYAVTLNPIIFGLNLLFAFSLILLPISYRKRK